MWMAPFIFGDINTAKEGSVTKEIKGRMVKTINVHCFTKSNVTVFRQQITGSHSESNFNSHLHNLRHRSPIPQRYENTGLHRRITVKIDLVFHTESHSLTYTSPGLLALPLFIRFDKTIAMTCRKGRVDG